MEAKTAKTKTASKKAAKGKSSARRKNAPKNKGARTGVKAKRTQAASTYPRPRWDFTEDSKIKLVKGAESTKREGSFAAKQEAAVLSAKTVGDYLKKKDANRFYLRQAVTDGLITLH